MTALDICGVAPGPPLTKDARDVSHGRPRWKCLAAVNGREAVMLRSLKPEACKWGGETDHPISSRRRDGTGQGAGSVVRGNHATYFPKKLVIF